MRFNRTGVALAFVAVLAVTSAAQTTQTFGYNEMTINGIGAGGTSCITAAFAQN